MAFFYYYKPQKGKDLKSAKNNRSGNVAFPSYSACPYWNPISGGSKSAVVPEDVPRGPVAVLSRCGPGGRPSGTGRCALALRFHRPSTD